ncbi:MAG: hypothetical protein K2Y22_09355 [Candidatus Obscuribacterales bacterium]|nr:hypothetical protein [Candidatus Obscuribacterales bacterium]
MPDNNNTSKLSSRFIYALAGFALVNLVVWKTSAFGLFTPQKDLQQLVQQNDESDTTSMSKTWPWWIAKAYLDEKRTPDVVVLGDSQMATAIFTADAKASGKKVDVIAHRHVEGLEQRLSNKLARPVSVFNAAMAGSMASDHNLIARSLFLDNADTEKPKLVVIGISPRIFIDNTLPSAGTTEPFRFFSQCADPGNLAQLAFGDYFGQMNWYINKYLPLGRLKTEMQTTYSPAKFLPKTTAVAKKSTQEADFMKGMFASSTKVEKDSWFVPAFMPYLFKDNTAEYVNRYTNPNPPLYASELAFFSDLLERLNASKVPTLIVMMPSLGPNRALLPDTFWKVFRTNISTLCNKNNATLADMSTSPDFVLEDYLDTVHLNANGGLKLLTNIANSISDDRNLTAGLTNQPVAIKQVH